MKKQMLKTIEHNIIFNKKAILSLSNGISNASVDYNISRWISDGTLVLLKNGLYTTSNILNTYRYDWKFEIFIANALRFPSYVTAETVLSRYGVLTEDTFGISSFTLKLTRDFENKLNSFGYFTIPQRFYGGYETDYFLDKKIYYATKGRALFDYLYSKRKIIPDDLEAINLVEYFRLKLEDFDKKDFADLTSFKPLNNKLRLSKIINNVLKYASDN